MTLNVTISGSVPFFGKLHCIYVTANTDLGTVTGGNPSVTDISSADIPRLKTDTPCDPTANWDASCEVTSPRPLHVTGHA